MEFAEIKATNAKIAEIKKTVALDGNARYKITTDDTDKTTGVSITYKDKDTQSMISEMYAFKSITEETETLYEGLLGYRRIHETCRGFFIA